MSFLSVTNWGEYQHYRDRTPIWIKLHVEALHDEKLRRLPLSTRLLWFEMLLLAATFQNSVPNSPELIGNLAGIPSELCREGVAELLKVRLLREKSSRRSASKAASVDKKRREEKRMARKFKTLASNLSTTLTLEQLVEELKAAGADEVTARRIAGEARAA